MSVADFYDQLSPFYHLIYPDWAASITWQAAALDSVIRELWAGRVHTILDAACGIGTQTIGLAELGYAVSGSDVSPTPLERARRTAAERGLSIAFSCADVRSLSAHHATPFDLIVACDNALPHLLTDAEIATALREMHRCCRPGGGVLVSVRDYDPSESSGTKVVPYGVRVDGARRYVVLQVWEFHGPVYDLSMYFMEDTGGPTCTTHVMRTQYYAIPVAHLMELMVDAGFQDVRRFDDRFFQPLLAGTKST